MGPVDRDSSDSEASGVLILERDLERDRNHVGSGFFGKPVKPVNRTRTSGLPKFREVSETSDSEGNRRYLPPAPQSLMVPLLLLLSSLHSAPPPLRVPDCWVTPSFMAGECMTWVSFFFVIFYSFEKFILAGAWVFVHREYSSQPTTPTHKQSTPSP